MNLFLHLVVHTANVLGSFNDPFEFDGDYGPEANTIRAQVFEAVVSKEALARGLLASDDSIAYAIEQDKQKGPTFAELIPPDLIDALKQKQRELESFDEETLQQILHFLSEHRDERAFYFFRHTPPNSLSLDKRLRDNAARSGKPFALPILSSTEPLQGEDVHTLKLNLLHALFTEETLRSARPLTENGIFTSPAGQATFYWMYQALNLHLIPNIEQVNRVKQIFLETLGDPVMRANTLKHNLLEAHSQLLFTQESDTHVPHALINEGPFLPIDGQDPKDGTFIFLHSDFWEKDYQTIPIPNYNGNLNVILATHKESGLPFLLASGHGHSLNAADGRLQVTLIMQKFTELQTFYPSLQLVIGMDANTKTEQDLLLFQQLLTSFNLTATSSGPTTVKQRMVTVQHSKAGHFAADEEDYIITRNLSLQSPSVGFQHSLPPLTPLPNLSNPSDHYPIGAHLMQEVPHP